jgi:hypothetical protein
LSKKPRTRFCGEPGCNQVIIKKKTKYCQRHHDKHFNGMGPGWIKTVLDKRDAVDSDNSVPDDRL